LYFQIANVYFEVDPSYGGRISSLKIDNNEYLYVSLDYGYLWGSTFWQSPQSAWGEPGNWPPSAILDEGSYSGGIAGDSILLRSKEDVTFHLIFKKIFKADLTDTSITINYSIINTDKVSHSYSAWELTRVPCNGLFLFPAGPGGIAGASSNQVDTLNGIDWYLFNASKPSGQKFYADGKEGWSAWVNTDNVVFVKRFKDLSDSMKAPNENEVELYYNNSSSYIELENQGPYTFLDAGDSLNWSIKWYLRKLPAAIKVEEGSNALVDFIRGIGKGDSVKTNINFPRHAQNEIKVYPNSAKNFITIEGIDKPASITISGINGQTILNQQLALGLKSISLPEVADGVYIYQITMNSKSYFGKFLIRK
jgi:hypothetical protein